jgi:tetratricopeptide (TPR) repeat protein
MSDEYPGNDEGNLGAAFAVAGIAVAAGIWALFKGADNHDTGLSKDASQSEIQALFDSAVVNVQQNNFNQAIQIFSELLARNPSHAPTYDYLAWIYAVNNYELDQALSFASRAVELADDPLSRSYFLDTLAEVYLRRGELAQAVTLSIEFLNTLKAFNQIPNSPVTYFRLAWCYQANNDFNSAYSFLQQALQINGLGAGEYVVIGDICFAMATVCFNQALYHDSINHYENAKNQYLIAIRVATANKIPTDLICFKLSMCLNGKGAAFYYLEDHPNSKLSHQEAYNAYSYNPYPLINLAQLEAREKNKQQMLYLLGLGIPLIVDAPPFLYKDHLVFALLNELDFDIYQDDVLQLLFSNGKISPADYNRALRNWTERTVKTNQPINFSQQNFYSPVSGVAGNVEGNFISRPQDPSF